MHMCSKYKHKTISYVSCSVSTALAFPRNAAGLAWTDYNIHDGYILQRFNTRTTNANSGGRTSASHNFSNRRRLTPKIIQSFRNSMTFRIILIIINSARNVILCTNNMELAETAPDKIVAC